MIACVWCRSHWFTLSIFSLLYSLIPLLCSLITVVQGYKIRKPHLLTSRPCFSLLLKHSTLLISWSQTTMNWFITFHPNTINVSVNHTFSVLIVFFCLQIVVKRHLYYLLYSYFCPVASGIALSVISTINWPICKLLSFFYFIFYTYSDQYNDWHPSSSNFIHG